MDPGDGGHVGAFTVVVVAAPVVVETTVVGVLDEVVASVAVDGAFDVVEALSLPLLLHAATTKTASRTHPPERRMPDDGTGIAARAATGTIRRTNQEP